MIDHLKEILERYELDAIVVEEQYDVLESLSINKPYNFLEIAPLLLITKDKIFLIGDIYTVEEFKKYEVEIIPIENIEYLDSGMSSFKEMVRLFKRLKVHRVGAFVPMDIPGVETVVVEDIFRESFLIPDARSLKNIKKAARICGEVLKELPDAIRDAEDEIGLRNLVDRMIYDKGGKKRGYPTRVISGKRTSNPLSVTDNHPIRSPIIVDFGVLFGNRGAGFTRTYTFDNRKTTEIYNHLVDIRNRLLDYIRPGRVCSAVYKQYLKLLSEAGLERFSYGPISKPILPGRKGIYISPNSTDVFVPGMVLHIDVGLYIPGRFGVRLQDPVIIEERAYTLLK